MKMVLVDLSKKTVKMDELPENLKRFIGGKGIATKLLIDLLPPGIDPFSQDNLLVFATGPLNGIVLSGASRLTCHFKSPMTNGYGEKIHHTREEYTLVQNQAWKNWNCGVLGSCFS
jgi:aldehyde:ferredoxin oxidoreductase